MSDKKASMEIVPDKKVWKVFTKSPIKGMIDREIPYALRPYAPYINEEADSFVRLFAESKEAETGNRAALNQSRYTVSHTGLSSRVLSHWAGGGGLPEGVSGENDGSWKKFTFVELVWIRAVRIMREYGMDMFAISLVRMWVMQWDKKNRDYPWFEFYVTLALMSDLDPYIVIYPSSHAVLATSYDIERVKVIDGSQSLLVISLRKIISDLGIKLGAKSEFLIRLTKAEKKLYDEIHFGENKEIKVRVDDDKIKELETMKIYSNKWNIVDIGKEIEKGGDYAEMTTRFSAGGQQTTEVRKKKRFK